MHRLNKRLQNLEVKSITPFFLPLIDDWNLPHFHSLRASYGIAKDAPGQVALIHENDGYITTLDYDPNNEALFEKQLNESTPFNR